ncbi:MAG: SDR family NAD(P)-dependent oxidoreductase [Bacteroidales bacterium]|nr:SDR family NAD(P)-dependent oxidoreductase [Bacteroidales bacterium]
MKQALVVGGSNGIGLALTMQLLNDDYNVIVADKIEPEIKSDKISYIQVNLLNDDFSFLNDCNNIDTLIITAGFGRVTKFDTIIDTEISNSFQVNTISVIKILKYYYSKLKSADNFRCAVMCSISGLVSSPLFALYSSTKAALCNLIESLNIELEMSGSNNRILNVSPGSIKGTKFNGGQNNMEEILPLAKEILANADAKNTLFIPLYNEVFKDVIDRYRTLPHEYGVHSYNYKMESGRFNDKPQIKIGYLSGTFDLFHIGHLNLLRRAKQCCDYLVVGIHKDGLHKGKETFIPFEERMDIVKNIKYVDNVIMSEREDSDVYFKGIVKYDYLFVGSDYKGTERFNKYEELFANEGVKIIYFPYTQRTSSTQLREVLNKNR